MPNNHQDAMSWAQANPQDPRAQDVMAKAWAAQNPQDPRAAKIMAKFSQGGSVTASPNGQNPNSVDRSSGPAPNKDGHSSGNQDIGSSPTEKPLGGTHTPPDLSNNRYMGHNINEDIAANPLTQKIIGGIQAGGVGEMVAPLGQMVTGGLSKLIGKGAGMVANGAERAGLTDMMKGTGDQPLDQYVKSQFDQAGEQYKGAVTNRLRAERLQGLQGKEVPVTAEQFTGISPELDEYAQSIQGQKSIPGDQAYEKLNQINQNTKFLNKGAYADPTVAKSAQASYKAGNTLREQMGQISDVDRDLGAKQNQAYDLNQAVQNSANTRPIEAIRNLKPGSTRYSQLTEYDKLAGSDLVGLGGKLDTVAGRLSGQPPYVSIPQGLSKFVPFASTINKGLSYVPRAADATAQVVNPAVQGAAKMATSAVNSAPGSLGSLAALQAFLQRNTSNPGSTGN